jgi:hypothetical protein
MAFHFPFAAAAARAAAGGSGLRHSRSAGSRTWAEPGDLDGMDTSPVVD